MNPVLPLHHRVPDAEARVFGGRVYFYGSYDERYENYYCSDKLHVFSTDDLVHYTDHGVVITSSQTDSPDAFIYAPDCIQKDDKYYLYFACSDQKTYVAVSDSPSGPFTACTRLALPVDQIDPAVLADDDGSYWLYWGQFDCRCVRLADDMRHVLPETYVPSLLNERDHGFHEGTSIRKIDGRYVLVFSDISRGRPTCLSWAESDRPDGPYTKRGVLIDTAEGDPESWNDHGSLLHFGGRWYVCCHKSSMCAEGMRRLCVEPIDYRDGFFYETALSTNGVEPPLDPAQPLPAVYAATLTGKVRMDRSERFLSKFEHASRACFRWYRFSGQTVCVLRAACQFEGCGLRLLADGQCVGYADIPRTGGWMSGGVEGFTEVTLHFPPLQGIRSVTVEGVCAERRWFTLESIRFE